VFEESDASLIKIVDAEENGWFEIYDSLGRKVGEVFTSPIDVVKKLKDLHFDNGIYILKSPQKKFKVIVD
jgi:hypothetical protein